MSKFRHLGLLLPGTRAEIQVVKPAHKKTCDVCGAVPKKLRLLLREGSGRAAETFVLCPEHGQEWLWMIETETTYAQYALATGELDEPVRQDCSIRDDLVRVKAERARRRREKKQD